MAIDQRWRYKVVSVGGGWTGDGTAKKVEAELAKLGSSGWELVAATRIETGSQILYLKRPS